MLKNYTKMAFKVFLRRKFFTAISLFAISFTLMIVMVATTFLDHIFGAYPPETKHDRTLGVIMARMTSGNGRNTGPVGYGFLDKYVRDLPGLEMFSISSFWTDPVISYWQERKIEVARKRTDGTFWRIFDFQFVEGGPYTEEDVNKANFVVVINEATREKFFGSSRAVGKTIEVDGQQVKVIGVVENVPGFRAIPFADIWIPITTQKSQAYQNDMMGAYQGLLLAKSTLDIPMIKEALRERLPYVETTEAGMDRMYVKADTYFEIFANLFLAETTGNYEESYGTELLLIILFIIGLFMLLPAINLININVSRIMERSSEIGVRKAFGASSWTLVGQFVMENVLLTLIGGAIGFILSWIALDIISRIDLLTYAQFRVNYDVFIYAFLAMLFFGIFSGVYPAWRMSRLHPTDALRGGVR